MLGDIGLLAYRVLKNPTTMRPISSATPPCRSAPVSGLGKLGVKGLGFRVSSMVALQAKPGPTNADLAEPFLRVCDTWFSKCSKYNNKPEIVHQALQYQLFILQQEYLTLRLAGASATQKLTRAAYVWDALRAANRVPESERPRLLNAILGDYQKHGLGLGFRGSGS